MTPPFSLKIKDNKKWTKYTDVPIFTHCDKVYCIEDGILTLTTTNEKEK